MSTQDRALLFNSLRISVNRHGYFLAVEYTARRSNVYQIKDLQERHP
jgi:hypothetical protein